VVEERLRRLEETLVEELDERPELVGIALVWGGRQEEQVADMMTKVLSQAVILGGLDLPAVSDPAQVVRLVEDRDVPAGRCQQALQPGPAFQGIDGRDDPEALNRVREGEHLLDLQAAREIVVARGWDYCSLGRACLLLGRSTRHGAWPTARSGPLSVISDSQLMPYTCSATSRPIPNGSTLRAAKPTTVRP
jgi:hypothetical protein